MALNENIKKFRKEAGLTQKTLAVKSGLSFSMISKLESGEQSNPSFETIRKIAAVLKVAPGELLNASLSVEEQIDEYMEYKRGLGKSTAAPAFHSEHPESSDHNGPWTDLNFRKKLQGINHIPEPAGCDGNEPSDYYPEMRPEMKKLFYALKNATKDEINQVTRLVETFRRV